LILQGGDGNVYQILVFESAPVAATRKRNKTRPMSPVAAATPVPPGARVEI
jgi:hypothetical protein